MADEVQFHWPQTGCSQMGLRGSQGGGVALAVALRKGGVLRKRSTVKTLHSLLPSTT